MFLSERFRVAVQSPQKQKQKQKQKALSARVRAGVAGHLAIRLNAMLEAEELPTGVSDLHAALLTLDRVVGCQGVCGDAWCVGFKAFRT